MRTIRAEYFIFHNFLDFVTLLNKFSYAYFFSCKRKSLVILDLNPDKSTTSISLLISFFYIQGDNIYVSIDSYVSVYLSIVTLSVQLLRLLHVGIYKARNICFCHYSPNYCEYLFFSSSVLLAVLEVLSSPRNQKSRKFCSVCCALPYREFSTL